RLKDKAISIVLEPYAFQGTQSTLDERFELRFVNSITGFDLDFKELSILSLKSGISFRNIPNTQNTEITVFELSGRKLLKQSLTLHQDETFTYQPKLPTGIYIYNLVFGGELFEGRMKIE
ncbi:MAG: T9SS type A sorting domain-containing protein, partial [Cyclobacteriaceae bacterium]